MAPGEAAPATAESRRKLLGAWSTPHELVRRVVTEALRGLGAVSRPGRRAVRIVDPACGDGRFLAAAASAVEALGGRVHVTGLDVDPVAAAAARRALAGGSADRSVVVRCGDALDHDWGRGRFDLVVGNPPFLSQLAAATSRGAASRWGGGPYADTAVEFLALALELARPEGARIGLVLPQSVLASRDAGPVRAEVDRRTRRTWSWWSPERHFDAAVTVCALVLETIRSTGCVSRVSPNGPAALTQPEASRPGIGYVSRVSPNGPAALTQPEAGRAWPVWSDVVTRALGVPDLPELATAGVLGERAELRANFRDEYYGLVPAVAEGGDGPPLLTSGLIDPGRSHWGARTARFARHRFTEPRVELGRLSPPMRAWALAKLVPKVLVASQTRVLEALADPDGELLPGVPLTAITPLPLGAPDVERAVWEIAAVLTSPVASAWAWHHCAGTGLSSTALRTGPRVLAGLPWPAGELAAAVGALRDGHVVECGRQVDAAFGVDGKDADELHAWWEAQLPGQPAEASALAR